MEPTRIDLTDHASRERLAGHVDEVAALIRDDLGLREATVSVQRRDDGTTEVLIRAVLPK